MSLYGESRDFLQKLHAKAEEFGHEFILPEHLLFLFTETPVTEEIFKSLNREIEQVGDAIGGIGTEVGDLENHKSVIENGVTSLTASADENAKSAEVTTDNMGRLRGVVKECDGVKAHIVSVSDELIGYIRKFSDGSILDKFGAGKNR